MRKRHYPAVEMHELQGRPIPPGFHTVRVGPGDDALVCTRQAVGALPNGTRIQKTARGDVGDAHVAGDKGTVRGSLYTGSLTAKAMLPKGIPTGVRFFYWVAWDDNPELPIGVLDFKIERIP